MANDAAWSEGWAQGREIAQDRRVRKEMLTDEERQQKASDLIATRNGILSKLPTLLGPNGEKTPEYDAAFQSLTQAQQDLGQLYHPDKAPGALQKDWAFLLQKMHGIVPSKGANTPAAPTPRIATTSQPGVAATSMPGMAATPPGATQFMAVAKPKGLVESGNIPIWNRPSVLNDNGTHSSELSISMQDDKGNEVLIPLIVDGKFLTPDGKMPPGTIPHNADEWEKASPEWKALRMRAWQHYEQTGQHLGKFGGPTAQDDVDAYAQVLHNRGSALTANGLPAGPNAPLTTPALPAFKQPTSLAPAPPPVAAKPAPLSWKDRGQYQSPGEVKKKAAELQKAQQDAQLLAAGAGLSPAQAAQGQSMAQWARLDADMKAWDQHNPKADKDERDAVYSQLYEKYIGATGKGSWETVTGTISDPADPAKRVPVSYTFDKVGNRLTNFDQTPVNPDVARTFIPDPKASGTAAQDLKDYNNDPDPNKGTFATWKAKQTAEAKGLTWDAATGQIKNGDKRYNSWDANLPPDVQAMFKSQAAFMQKKQANALALAATRGAAAANARIIPVEDPSNPGTNIVVPAGLAYKLGYKVPSGAYYQAMTGMLKDATYGQIGNEFVAFGTALQHADQLQKAAIALNNGDTRSLNSIANQMSVAFGDPEVTNFDVVSQVYTGEITKAINAGHVTQSELEDNNALIPPNASPAQILGAIQNFKTLLNSKINMRIPQIQSALSQFGMDVPFTPPGYTPPAGHGGAAGSTGKKKVSLAKAKLKPDNKGKTDDQIKADIEAHGYEVIP